MFSKFEEAGAFYERVGNRGESGDYKGGKSC